jgi:hypothetical protein
MKKPCRAVVAGRAGRADLAALVVADRVDLAVSAVPPAAVVRVALADRVEGRVALAVRVAARERRAGSRAVAR